MSLRRNVVANYVGQGWAAFMGFAFVPQYVRLMGVEAYGLVGVFSVLQASMTLLDLGLTPTVNREMARLAAGAHTPSSIRNLLRSLEWMYVVIAIAAIVLVVLAAPWLASSWITSIVLPRSAVIHSIQIMAFVLAARAVEQVYKGALWGLQDVVWLNTIQALMATARWGGACCALLLSPNIASFFVWQGIVSVGSISAYRWRTYKLLPPSAERTAFSLSVLKEIRGFAGGMVAGAVLSVALTQADKIVVGKLLPLVDLGYYTVASTLVGGLLQLITPMNNSVYPKLIEHAAHNDANALYMTYAASCEWMSAVIVPPALVLIFFAKPVLLLWTGDVTLAESVAPLLSLLAAGTLLHGLMNVPYLLQLTYGWVRLNVGVNLVAVILVIPALVFAVQRYGAPGAAGVWLVLNLCCLLVVAQLMHRRLLKGFKWRWYVTAVLRPVAAGSAAALLFSIMAHPESRISSAELVLIGGTVIAIVVAIVLPIVRQGILNSVCYRAGG